MTDRDPMEWTRASGDPVVSEAPRSGQCQRCRHLHRGAEGWPSCDAFRRIPGVILRGMVDHRQPFPGDDGIRFEPDGEE